MATNDGLTSDYQAQRYELGCSECDAPKGQPCTTTGDMKFPRRTWHKARLESAEGHYRFGHQHGHYCDCGA